MIRLCMCCLLWLVHWVLLVAPFSTFMWLYQILHLDWAFGRCSHIPFFCNSTVYHLKHCEGINASHVSLIFWPSVQMKMIRCCDEPDSSWYQFGGDYFLFGNYFHVANLSWFVLYIGLCLNSTGSPLPYYCFPVASRGKSFVSFLGDLYVYKYVTNHLSLSGGNNIKSQISFFEILDHEYTNILWAY